MKIQQTENYSLFKRIKGNRTINKAQVKKLVDSFGEDPQLALSVPIVVNDKFEIIDGQHRFQALKKLGLPIAYYQVPGLTLHSVQTVNSATKVWNPIDYAKSYTELGNKNYKTYIDFRNKYHLGHTILLVFMGGAQSSNNTTTRFRKGLFVTGNVKEAETVCQRFVDVSKFYKRSDSRSFALAFYKIAKNAKYDHDRMLSQLERHPKGFEDSPFMEDYVRQFERIYNFHMKNIEGGSRVRLF